MLIEIHLFKRGKTLVEFITWWEALEASDPAIKGTVCDVSDRAAVDRLFKADLDPERVAAIILEPVQGAGGVVAHDAGRKLPVDLAPFGIAHAAKHARPKDLKR